MSCATLKQLGSWGVSENNFNNPLNFEKLESCDSAARGEKAALETQHTSLKDKVSRLLFLFLVDFLDGIDLAVVRNKDKRDRYFGGDAPSKVAMYCGWLMLVVLDIAMIGYTLLFALNASGNSQYAWCVTFAVWLFVEIVFISTIVTLWVHVWLPSFSYSGLQRVKTAVIQHLLRAADNIHAQTSFNAASHFFVSVRLASSLTEMDSDAKTAVLAFNTEWPREEFVRQGVVPSGSAASGVWYHLVRGSVSMPPVAHDVLVTTAVSLLVALIAWFLGAVYQTSPAIALAAVGVLICIIASIYVVGACSSGRGESLSPGERDWESVYANRMADNGDDDDNDDDDNDDDGDDDDDSRFESFGLVSLSRIDLNSNVGSEEFGHVPERLPPRSILDMDDDLGKEEDPFYLDLDKCKGDQFAKDDQSRSPYFRQAQMVRVRDGEDMEKDDSLEKPSYSNDVSDSVDDFASHQHVIEFNRIGRSEESFLGDDDQNDLAAATSAKSTSKSLTSCAKDKHPNSAIQSQSRRKSLLNANRDEEKDPASRRRLSLHSSRWWSTECPRGDQSTNN